MATPHEVLHEDHRQAQEMVRRLGLDRTRKVLERAEHELGARLRQVEGSRLGGDTFSAVRMRATLAQLRLVISNVQRGLAGAMGDMAGPAAKLAVDAVVGQLRAADKAFRGAGQRPLSLDLAAMHDAASSGAKASVLRRIAQDPDHPGQAGVLARYGLETIQHFEEILQRSRVTGAPWADVRRQLVEHSHFLQGVPGHWAERIIRTESMAVLNRATWESNRQANEQLGDVVKILSATFDDRTGADSIAVHGQIRRPDEAFQSWHGLYQHPPDRPNDREVVVTHRMAWPIPPYLQPRAYSEARARWRAEKRKGSMPPRPTMTTVDLRLFGRDPGETGQAGNALSPAVPAKAAVPEIPAARFAFRGPPPPPRPHVSVPELPPAPSAGEVAAKQEEIGKLAREDQERFRDPGAADERAAAAWKAFKKPRGSRDSVSLPGSSGEPPHGLTPEKCLDMVGVHGRDVSRGGTPERVLVSDLVPRDNSAKRYDVEPNLKWLARSGDFGDEEAPVLVRVGGKLYPARPWDDAKLHAARALGLRTMTARVHDVDGPLRAKRDQESRKVEERHQPRVAGHEQEVARVRREVEARVRREHEGDPEVVAARTRHQPAEHEAKFLEKYREAAASVGWGSAMLERGLDLPLPHLREVARRFDEPGHPMRSQVAPLEAAERAGHRTLRDALGAASPEQRDGIRAAAAVMGHADAVNPTQGFDLTTQADMASRHDQVATQLRMLAQLTDRSVSVCPVNVARAGDGERASCNSSSMARWGPRKANLRLGVSEDTPTVWHEMGHALDAADRGRGQRASAFLDARTAGHEASALSKLTGNPGYLPQEVARPDKFFDPYVGKDYGREAAALSWRDPYYGPKEAAAGVPETKAVHEATEVTSMAVEALARDPARAIARDEEHFFFALGQLGGY